MKFGNQILGLVLFCFVTIKGRASKLQEDVQCSIPGICIGGTFEGATSVKDEQECIDACKLDDKCNWYTYSPLSFYARATNSCLKFDNCTKISTDDCPKCLSGQKACDKPVEPTCNEDNCCQGKIIKIEQLNSFEDCYKACQNNKDCNWATYYFLLRSCFLLSDCPTYSDDVSSTCMTSERRCEPPTPLICNATDCCSGRIIDEFLYSNTSACLEKCSQNTECNWMSFNTDSKICYNLYDCDLVPNTNCESAESQCKQYGRDLEDEEDYEE